MLFRSVSQSRYKAVMRMLDNNVVLAEEQLVVRKVLAEEGVAAIGGAPTNNTSGPVATQEPKIGKKNIKKYQVMSRRSTPVEC